MTFPLKNDISKLAFALTMFVVLGLSFLLLFGTSTYDYLSKEDHVAEYLSSMFLFISSFFFFKTSYFLISKKKNYDKWLIFFSSFLCFLLFLGAGEEISWGQRIFDIQTPEYLLEINDQDELNFHNIDKKFFDRALDRLTIAFVVIGSLLYVFKKNTILKIKAPNLFIICIFLITPFYRQNIEFNFFYILYIPLIVLLFYSIINENKFDIMLLITTLIMTFIVLYIHSEYGYLFPSHNNSANEFKEFIFCFGILIYSFEIMKDIINRKIVSD